nr:MAG TPA: Bifunctional DNA primase polymerase [Caudoviricetes sp.]
MDELQDLLSFAWRGTKKGRYTRDRWSDDKNCRPLKSSRATANALLTGYRQLDKTGRWKLVAVDLDNKDNWGEVINTFKALELPQTLTVATPSGGYHLFYWVAKDVPAQNINDDRHCKHFELKGDGGNITAPGSVFDCGATYKVVRDMPIARLLANEAYRLCKFKQEWRPPREFDDFTPDRSSVEAAAHNYDERARRNPRGWQIRCPFHDDQNASAVIFNSGWLYCSGCGHTEKVVKSDNTQL